LLRHIIFNDDKSSTYKLALLRVLCRIADGTAGYARMVEGAPNWVELPLGLVALFWLRQYMPLLKAGLPQQPNNRGLDGLGFVKEAFRGLVAPACNTSALDLRVGMRFEGERAQQLHQALRDACKTIQEMPARYLTHPDGSNILAVTRHGRVARPQHLLLDEAYLSSFGHLRLPQHLYTALQRFDAWIDHCLPWHAWPCSDLWNLMPASSQLNRQKSDRVPSEVMLRGAQTRIQDWWAQAYDGVLGERFRLEAQASLPLVGDGAGVEEVYAGVRVQRLRLRFDLGVGEWG
jgi:hypothetical protein